MIEFIDPRIRISPRIYKGVRIVNRPDPDNVRRLDAACLPAICAMERNGVRIDKKHLLTLHNQLTGDMADIQRQVVALTGKDVLLSSGDQVAELLYTHLGLKQAGKPKMTRFKTRMAADSDVLRGMIAKHPVIPLILKHKEMAKLQSSFTLTLIEQAGSDGRIRCRYNHTSTETGRLSSSNPNLQQIPGRTALGKEIRKGFVADPGEVLGVCDASQIECRTVGMDALCSSLLEIFWGKKDLYWSISEDVYKRQFSDDERKHGIEPISGLSFKSYYRQCSKTITLGILYSISPAGLVDLFLSSDPPAIAFLTDGGTSWDYAKHYETALRLCANAMTEFFNSYPEILKRRKEHHRRARRYGLCWEMFGRHRWIPQVKSTQPNVQAEGERAGGNLPGQGSAAGILKLWTAITHDRIESYWGKFGVRMIMSTHDEQVTSGKKEVMPDFLKETEQTLKDLLPFDYFPCPLDAESAYGERYGDIK